jgi:multidrug resistance efflux pump
MKKQLIFLVSLLFIVLFLAGCTSKSATDNTAIPIQTSDSIISEGHFVPKDNLYLSFLVRGTVSKIMVKQGDQITEGQPLIQLKDSQQAEAAFTGAQLELTSAQQQMDALLRTTELGKAQAQMDYIAAQKARNDAQLAWDRLDLDAIQTNIDNAQEFLDNQKEDLTQAQEDFDKYANLPTDDTNRKTAENKLKTAQSNYDNAIRNLLDQTNRRDIPRSTLDSALVLESEAKRTFENTKNGPDADKLALAQARLDNAKAQVAAAQKSIDSYVLNAPFDGIVADINVSLNQQVGPEIWAVVIIDSSQWYVETSDLTEYDVVKIKMGETANITVDALPELSMTGVVEEIALAPKSQAGDIIYTVRLRVDNPDPTLKWGMTMEVTFPIQP